MPAPFASMEQRRNAIHQRAAAGAMRRKNLYPLTQYAALTRQPQLAQIGMAQRAMPQLMHMEQQKISAAQTAADRARRQQQSQYASDLSFRRDQMAQNLAIAKANIESGNRTRDLETARYNAELAARNLASGRMHELEKMKIAQNKPAQQMPMDLQVYTSMLEGMAEGPRKQRMRQYILERVAGMGSAGGAPAPPPPPNVFGPATPEEIAQQKNQYLTFGEMPQETRDTINQLFEDEAADVVNRHLKTMGIEDNTIRTGILREITGNNTSEWWDPGGANVAGYGGLLGPGGALIAGAGQLMQGRRPRLPFMRNPGMGWADPYRWFGANDITTQDMIQRRIAELRAERMAAAGGI